MVLSALGLSGVGCSAWDGSVTCFCCDAIVVSSLHFSIIQHRALTSPSSHIEDLSRHISITTSSVIFIATVFLPSCGIHPRWYQKSLTRVLLLQAKIFSIQCRGSFQSKLLTMCLIENQSMAAQVKPHLYKVGALLKSKVRLLSVFFAGLVLRSK